jgi:cob(I)alamin adenosyltransferase
MVKLNRIYTRTGDDGTTGLVTGQRVLKTDLRVEAYGMVDEANAMIGVAVVAAQNEGATEILGVLREIQHDLFDLGADLATPVQPNETPAAALRVLPEQTVRIEKTIDRFNEGMAPLTSFVLPGGTPLAASLHVARTVVRRAERVAVGLLREREAEVAPEGVKYLNRLSDLLFVLSRVANNRGQADVLWVPGANRGKA